MNQFFYIITEYQNEIFCRVYTTETKVLYAKKQFITHEEANEFGKSYCNEIGYINGSKPFIKKFPIIDHLT